jgi:hypothetical protein
VQTKLTLRMDSDLIRRAKGYARRSGKSVSRIVAEYFALLGETAGQERESLPPLVRSLRGAWSGSRVSEEEYHQYLEEKHT